MTRTAVYRDKGQLNELFQRFKQDYRNGLLKGQTMDAIATRYNITGPTVKRWIIRIDSEKKNKPGKKLIEGVPSNWQWLKITVSKEVKDEFDKLTPVQKIILYKLMDTDIKLLSVADQDSIDAPIQVKGDESLVDKTIGLKVSPEAIAIWGQLPTIRKNNEFSRASWAVNKVILPFLNLPFLNLMVK